MTDTAGTLPRHSGPMRELPWLRLTSGLVAVFLLFQLLAARLGSDRGQSGIVVASGVVLATIAVQVVLFGQAPRTAARWLGLGRPTTRALAATLAICSLLGLVVPAFARARDVPVEIDPGWPELLAGLFAQAGIAEEVLFRGYLFHHVRSGRPFRRAVLLSLVPFAAVHFLLFQSMPWPIALAAVALAVVLTPPLAHLFELGGNTIWAPAILHFVVQGAAKLVQFPGEESRAFPMVWMAAAATLPFLVFLVRPSPRPTPV